MVRGGPAAEGDVGPVGGDRRPIVLHLAPGQLDQARRVAVAVIVLPVRQTRKRTGSVGKHALGRVGHDPARGEIDEKIDELRRYWREKWLEQTEPEPPRA